MNTPGTLVRATPRVSPVYVLDHLKAKKEVLVSGANRLVLLPGLEETAEQPVTLITLQRTRLLGPSVCTYITKKL